MGRHGVCGSDDVQLIPWPVTDKCMIICMHHSYASHGGVKLGHLLLYAWLHDVWIHACERY